MVFVGTPVGVRPAGVVIIVALLILTTMTEITKRDHCRAKFTVKPESVSLALYMHVCAWTCVFLNRSSFMFVQARADAGPVRGLTVSELAL